MRTWIKSACVVLAWSILPLTLVTAGMTGSASPAQVSTRTAAHSTELIRTSTLSPATAVRPAASPAPTYVVHDGDTLSAIAARFAIHGGWPALYAANQQAIGPNPDILRPGTVLVLPGPAPARYTVTAGDTLSAIAARFAIHGGWPALYAANQLAIGPDPDIIHVGTVLTLPHPATPAPPTPGPAHQQHPAPPPSRPATTPHHPRPVTKGAPAATGMPQWLKTILLAVALIVLVAFITEPVLAARRRQQGAALASQPATAGSGRRPCVQWPSRNNISIVLADHDRLVVTCNKDDDTVYVLRPPGQDPQEILRVACLVLPEGSYGELARRLGMPAHGPVQ